MKELLMDMKLWMLDDAGKDVLIDDYKSKDGGCTAADLRQFQVHSAFVRSNRQEAIEVTSIHARREHFTREGQVRSDRSLRLQ